jgi:CBS domain-containing protein
MPRTIRSIIEDQEPVTAPAHTTVAEAARLMKKRAVGALMIVEDDKLVGIFTERDALFKVNATGLNAQTTQIAEVMTRNPQTIHPDKPFLDALHLMHESSFRHIPVVENGRPIGMISARDAFGSELGELLYEFVRQERVSHLIT